MTGKNDKRLLDMPNEPRVLAAQARQRGDACVARDHGENTNRRGQYVEGECQGKAFLLTKAGSIVRLSGTDFRLLAVKAPPASARIHTFG